MNVCVDVGNTMIKLGFYQANNLINKITFFTNPKYTPDELEMNILSQIKVKDINPSEVENVIYGSVVPSLNQAFIVALEEIFHKKVILVGPGLKTSLTMRIDNPLEVGSDLIADLVAGKEKYGFPLLIVDLGTATKILLLDKDGAFSSCVILPGIDNSLNALSSNAALLPEVAIDKIKPLLQCKNTVDAMTSGISYGHYEMVKGICKRYEDELGYKCKKIITGGSFNNIKNLFDELFTYDENLTLDGFNILLTKQKGNK